MAAIAADLQQAGLWLAESKRVAAIRSCDTMLVIGTSALVQPAASLAIVAKEKGARVVEINLEPTPYSHKLDLSLQGKAGILLPQLVEGM
ncbi:MAG: hypothetical protein V3U56_07590 [Syntrophobacteria bacterium]